MTDEEGDGQLIATGHERDTLMARKATLEARGKEQDGTRAQLTAAESLLVELRGKAEDADGDTKRRIIETLVKSITAEPAEDKISLSITYRFTPPGEYADNALIAAAP